jgi:tRNA (guanine37-N1)-methyltransferase
MRIDVLTLFPGAFGGILETSILGRARAAGLFTVHFTDIRDFAADKHRSVDDYPFGGGQGMVMRADVLDAALSHAVALAGEPPTVVALTPQGEVLTDALVRELAKQPRLVLVCGRYEGMDERFLEHRVDREISIGDYVLTGGELPAMVVIDSVARHIPGVLGDEQSPEDESFADGLLEHPQYTRPAEYNGWEVPSVLLGGNHAAIEAWRAEQRLERTRARRPDLLERAPTPPGNPARNRRAARLRVREADWEADRDALHTLWVAADRDPGALQPFERLEPGLCLVAEAREGLAGAIFCASDGLYAQIHDLVVAPRARGRGVSDALVAELESRTRMRGLGAMRIIVEAGNWPAMRLFGRLGWTRLHTAAWSKPV